ncbi:hypothetical protein ScPMuIL_018343 [Solemya velum]
MASLASNHQEAREVNCRILGSLLYFTEGISMSTSSSDSESISDWTLLDEDGDVESTDESSSTGSSVEVLDAEVITSDHRLENSTSPVPVEGAMFILRVNSREQGISESEDSDGNQSTREKRQENNVPPPIGIATQATTKDTQSPVVSEEKDVKNQDMETSWCAEKLKQEKPPSDLDSDVNSDLTSEGDGVSSAVQSIEMSEDDLVEGLHIVSIGSCVLSDSVENQTGDQHILDERQDEAELSSDISDTEVLTMTENEHEEDIMESSTQSSVSSSFSFVHHHADVPPADHEAEDIETEEKSEVAVMRVLPKECSSSKVTATDRLPSNFLEVSVLVVVTVLALAMAVYIAVDSIGWNMTLGPEQKLYSCELNLKGCFEEQERVGEDLQQMFHSHSNCMRRENVFFEERYMFTKNMIQTLKKFGTFDAAMLDNMAIEDREKLVDVFNQYLDKELMDAREVRQKLKAKEQENEIHKNEANQMRVEAAELRSIVSRLRYAIMSPIAQREREAVQRTQELHQKVGQLEEEREELLNEIESFRHSDDESRTEGKRNVRVERLMKELEMQRIWSHSTDAHHKKEHAEKDWLGCFTMLMENGSILPTMVDVLGSQWVRVTNLTMSTWEDYVIKPWTNSDNGKDDVPLSNEAEDTEDNSEGTLTDSVFDILNKTQNSVFDISKQIQDTWNQVKNLSEDMWTQSEPTLNRLQKKFTNKLQKVSQHFQNKVNQKIKRWLHKGRRNPNSRKRDVPQRDFTGADARSFRASSKRRQHTVGNRDRGQPNQKLDKKMARRCDKSFNKFLKRIREMSRRDFKDLTATDLGIVLEQFEEFTSTFGTHVLMESSKVWFQCQYGWWVEIAHGNHPKVDKKCYSYMKGWQLKESKSVKWRKWKKVGWNILAEPCIKSAFENVGDKDIPSQTNPVDDKSKFDDGFNGEPGRKVKRGGNDNMEIDLHEETLDTVNIRGDNSHVADNEVLNSTEELVLEICNSGMEEEDTKASWYMKMIAGRKYIRNVQEDSTYDGDHKADWLFERADNREFERERPDDWFFRRTEKFESNKKGD